MPELPADAELPLFPLQAVLFPDGLLNLKVFEARYLDLVASCLREQREFGVVGLRRGAEVRRADQSIAFESVGTRAGLLDVDSAQTGILLVRCRGGARFAITSSRQQEDGLWLARVTPLEPDPPTAPPPALAGAVRGLKDAMASLEAQEAQPFLLPHRFDDAGWVANRWCELLPIPQAARQKLMELRDPLVRLELVDDFLRRQGVLP
jgi:Lon protease-like protein